VRVSKGLPRNNGYRRTLLLKHGFQISTELMRMYTFSLLLSYCCYLDRCCISCCMYYFASLLGKTRAHTSDATAQTGSSSSSSSSRGDMTARRALVIRQIVNACFCTRRVQAGVDLLTQSALITYIIAASGLPARRLQRSIAPLTATGVSNISRRMPACLPLLQRSCVYSFCVFMSVMTTINLAQFERLRAACRIR